MENNQGQAQTPQKKFDIIGTLNKVPGKLMGMFNRLKAQKPKLAEQPQAGEQSQGETVVTSSSAAMPRLRLPKKLIVAGVTLLVFLVLVLVVLKIMQVRSSSPMAVATPTPTPTEIPERVIPSQYADDEDVLEITRRMDNLNKDLNEVSFRDDRLRVPSLDWDVSF